MLQKVCGNLDHCFIMTHSSHNEGDFTNLLWGDVPRNKTPHTGPRHTWSTYTLTFLSPQEEHTWQRSWVDDFTGQCLLWRLLSRRTFLTPALGLPTNLGVVQSWIFTASSIKFLTRRSLKSWWVYLALHEDNSIQLLSIANNYNGLPYLFSSVWCIVSETWCQWDMNGFYSDSKTDLKLRCDYCIKFQVFEGVQDITPQTLQITPALL